jgi:hypothetical protein
MLARQAIANDLTLTRVLCTSLLSMGTDWVDGYMVSFTGIALRKDKYRLL